MIYLISYDLCKPGRDYADLFDAIESLGSYSHCLESTWAVDSDLDLKQIYGKVYAKMDSNDRLLITPIDGYICRLKEKNTDWLGKHLQ